MIRLRCETGVRPRPVRSNVERPSDDWIELALTCARLQANFVVECGRLTIPFSELRADVHCDLPILLYEAGIVELSAWDETDHGRITRVRRADLSRAAAQALVEAKLLPKCFVSVLMSHDLLDDCLDGVSAEDAEILFEEFRAWLACGGLGAGALQHRDRGQLVVDIGSIINQPREGAGPKSFPSATDGVTAVCNIR